MKLEDGQKGLSIFLPEKNKRFFEQKEILEDNDDDVCVDVILEDKGEVLATTNLHFRQSPGAPTKKPKLKLVKSRR